MYSSSLMSGPSLAGFGSRFLAVLIESVIFGLIFGGAAALAALDAAGLSLAALGLGVVGLALAVFNLMLFAEGKTLGKKLLGLSVINEESGEPIGFWRMLLREVLGKWVSGSIFYLGFLWALWDGRSQTWHDKIFGTLVATDV